MAVYRGQREMEVEDLNIDEAPTKDVQTKTPDQAQEKTPKSETGSYRWVIVSFGLLCVLQATLNISLRLAFYNNQFETSNTNLTRERDQLKTKNTNLTRGREMKCGLCEVTSCPDGWLKLGNSRYYISTEMKNWADSRQDCIERGADLVIINSPEEQDFLSTKLYRGWIGLTDRLREGTFIWVDGTSLTTSFWGRGEPNDDKGGEDCVELTRTKAWNDHACSSPWQWICEKVI